MTIKIGFAALGNAPSEIVRLAVEAEKQGWARVWFGDHLAQPAVQDSRYPYADAPLTLKTVDYVDPLVQAAAVAAATTTIEIATGIFVLPMHHPLMVLRSLSTLHDVSQGRFVFGVGAGWMEEEFAAVGINHKARGRRMDESLQVLRAARGGGEIAFDGEQFSFPALTVSHRAAPVPLVIGGTSKAAYRRAAQYGDGWYSTPNFGVTDVVEARRQIEELREVHGVADRPFTYYVRLSQPDAGLLRDFVGEGFAEFTVGGTELFPRDRVASMSFEEKVNALAETAERLGVAPLSSFGDGE